MQKQVYEFISKQNQDPIIEWRTCTVSGKEFPLFQSDKEFYEKISPSFGNKKYMIPYPTLCPQERMRRRMAFRNVHKLYKGKDPLSDKSLVSPYVPDSPYFVVSSQDRFADDERVDARQYAVSYDRSKSFTEQFQQLQQQAPRRGSYITNSENCDWNTNTDNAKDCYMTAATVNGEQIYYSDTSFDSSYILDSLITHGSEHCANNIDCKDSYKVYDSWQVKGCSNSRMLSDCINCNFCLACSNLRNQEYHILNQPVSPEEYKKVAQQCIHDEGFYQDMQKKYQTLLIQTPKVACLIINAEQSFGHEIYDSREVVDGYNIQHSEDIRYARDLHESKTSQDIYKFEFSALCYEISTSYKMYHCLFCFNAAELRDCIYCETCYNCQHCFGCVGLKNKEYYIFNQQYMKDEYEQKIQKIIQKMQQDKERGEFFAPGLSPYGYNETDAMDYLPLDRAEALEKGYKWQDKNYDPVIPAGVTTLQGQQIVHDVSLVSDAVLSQIFICEVSGRPFRLVKAELDFYRQHHLSLPRKHPDIRYQEKVRQRGGGELYMRTCDATGEEILSVYPSQVDFKVYSETAYQQEIYG